MRMTQQRRRMVVNPVVILRLNIFPSMVSGLLVLLGFL